MRVIWYWLLGGYHWFRPGWCIDCREWTLVFKKRSGDTGRCERCWLRLK
jgi:hypothetical protein